MQNLFFPITGLYAGLLALLFLYLSARIPPLRRKHRVSLGDGGADELIRAVSAQGNCAEYAPLAILLFALCEANGLPGAVLHGGGLLFLLARFGHAVSILRPSAGLRLRVVSMATTFAVIGLAALYLLWRAAATLF